MGTDPEPSDRDAGHASVRFPSPAWTAVLLGLASLILVGIVATVVICELSTP